jgi:hypothetical protein
LKSVIDAKSEFRKVLIGTAVVISLLLSVLVAIYLGRFVTQTIEDRPVVPDPLVYEMLSMDRVQVGRFAVNLGFNAAPDSIIGVGDESVYRWGVRGKSPQFLEVSFKEGYIDYEAKPLKEATPSALPKVAEMIVARRLAWDFLLNGDLWDKRIEITPDVRLFSLDEHGVVSAVGSFKEADYFKVYFVGNLGASQEDIVQILAPDFETFLAKVEVAGQTGQVIKARIYPVFLGKDAKVTEVTLLRPGYGGQAGEDVATIENQSRPEEGFLTEGTIAYVAKKGDWLQLWEAQQATTKQVFRVF